MWRHAINMNKKRRRESFEFLQKKHAKSVSFSKAIISCWRCSKKLHTECGSFNMYWNCEYWPLPFPSLKIVRFWLCTKHINARCTHSMWSLILCDAEGTASHTLFCMLIYISKNQLNWRQLLNIIGKEILAQKKQWANVYFLGGKTICFSEIITIDENVRSLNEKE